MGVGGIEKVVPVPNDQYACTKCNLVPEIKNINYDLNMIEIECPKHGKQKLNIMEYFEKQKEHIYYSVKCSDTAYEQRKFLPKNQYFSHCFRCGKDLCLECTRRHHCNPNSRVKVNEINDICGKHFCKYEKYCFKCKKNCCKNCKCIHNDIKQIEKAKKEDIEKIKEKKKQLQIFIKFLDTIIETYEKHPTNYYNTINISNVANNQINQNKIVIGRLNALENKVLNYFNTKLNVKLNGNEKIIKLKDIEEIKKLIKNLLLIWLL